MLRESSGWVGGVFAWVDQDQVTQQHVPSGPGRLLFPLDETPMINEDAIPWAIVAVLKLVRDRKGGCV